MKFTYHARTKKGELKSGTVEASSKEAALSLLQGYDLFVTSLVRIGGEPFYEKPIRILEKVSRKDVVLFSRQMAIMLVSKVPISEVLRVLAHQTKKRVLRETIFKIAEEVEGGTAFSKTLSSYPKVFSPLYVALIRSGEASGQLSGTIEYLATHLEREEDFYSKVKGAIAYPAFIFLVFVFIGTAMIFLIIPQLSEILKEMGQELPLITRVVLSSTDFLRQWILVFIMVFIVFVLGIINYYKSKEGKKFFDRFFLAIPLIGDFLQKIYLARLSENLATLISGGIPISEALEIVSDVVGNETYKEKILETRDRVRRGEPMSLTFQRYPEVFPLMFSQMALVGERAGRISVALENTASFFRKEVDRGLDVLVSLLEPLMIVIMGLLVGGLVVSVLIPVYRISGM